VPLPALRAHTQGAFAEVSVSKGHPCLHGLVETLQLRAASSSWSHQLRAHAGAPASAELDPQSCHRPTTKADAGDDPSANDARSWQSILCYTQSNPSVTPLAAAWQAAPRAATLASQAERVNTERLIRFHTVTFLPPRQAK